MSVKLVLFLLFAWGHAALGKNKDEDELIIPLNLSYLGDKIFGTPSKTSGKLLNLWNENSKMNPEEMGEYAEGDILIPSKKRNGITVEFFKWKYGVIPYKFASDFDEDSKRWVKKAMDLYHKYTCITFRPKINKDRHYLEITSEDTGCWSSIGCLGGKQELNLQDPGCISVGTVVHELMHAVGFVHEQSRSERDDYVNVFLENVEKEAHHNFRKYNKLLVTGFNVDYDFNSIMHYSSHAFSKNGEPTMLPKEEGIHIGQRSGFSVGDIIKINRMYRCPINHDTLLVGSSNGNIITS